MISINGSLFIQMVNFIVLIWALNLVLYRPIRNIVARRREKMDGLEEGISKYEQDAVEKEREIQSGIKKAREKGQKEKEAIEEEAREQERRKVEQIHEKAKADLDEMRKKVVSETESVRKSLEPQIDQFADQISEKMLGRAVE
ncbi:MAG: ATPase [Desulfobacteraceae bacterium]|nr:ATPase [Desulfobacteraceae bacterium]MCF8094035.1 ATPase [Desulfobacteraceae bacterium]